MKLPALKHLTGIIILALTLGLFAYYFVNHPEVRQTLLSTPPTVLVGILFLYCMNIVAIALITIATLRMCNIEIPRLETIKLTAYTLIVNFFGPLQSGPAFRAVYLKKKHGVSLKKFAAATLVYYLVFGMLGLLFLATYWLDWRLGAIIVFGLICARLVLKTKPFQERLKFVDLKSWYFLAIATTFQLIIMTALYYLELSTTTPGTSLRQAIIYSGAANLALFVSLTPGAIGIRESFLALTQNMHHVSNSAIITTNILDRAMYVLLLGLIAVAIFATHTKEALTSDISENKPSK